MENYKLEYEVENALKNQKRKFVMLKDDTEISECDIVLTDYLNRKNCILCHNVKECIRKLQSYFYGKKRFTKLIVGIDPGPRPGIAVIGDGNVVEEIQIPNVKDVRRVIDEIYNGYSPKFFMIRIGDGDITNRNRIINSLIDSYMIEIVNEQNTSETITNKDIESAKMIAFTRGKIVRHKQNIVITEGYIKDIQRKSRIESNGTITISKTLAKKVALGELTLKDAIKIARNDE